MTRNSPWVAMAKVISANLKTDREQLSGRARDRGNPATCDSDPTVRSLRMKDSLQFEGMPPKQKEPERRSAPALEK